MLCMQKCSEIKMWEESLQNRRWSTYNDICQCTWRKTKENKQRRNKKRKYKEWEEDKVSEEEVFSEGDDESGEEDDFEDEEIGITRLFAGSDEESFYGFEEDNENNDSNKENLLNLSNTDKSILSFSDAVEISFIYSLRH